MPVSNGVKASFPLKLLDKINKKAKNISYLDPLTDTINMQKDTTPQPDTVTIFPASVLLESLPLLPNLH